MTQSEQLFEKSEHFLPGGVNSPVRAVRNVGGTPVFVKSGKGSHILDEDGNDYIDYVCSYGPGILGHAYPAVIEALRTGRFYWSQGPELKGVSIENGVLQVKTSPVEKIFVTVEGRDSYKAVVAPGESLTEAQFPLTGKEGWFRIQVRDSRGLFAGTNAYFIDQL